MVLIILPGAFVEKSSDVVRYVFRLSARAKALLDERSPPALRGKSTLVRQALTSFLAKSPAVISERPHIMGRSIQYTQVCVHLPVSVVAAIKEKYPESSVSVVIQAALLDFLK